MCAVAVFDSASLPLVEEMYAKFLADPASVDAEWKAYFLGWQAGGSVAGEGAGEGKDLARFKYAEAWRTRGHLAAWLNPLNDKAPEVPAELKAETYGLSEGEAGDFAKVYGGKVGVECGVMRVPAERAWVQDWWEGAAAKQKPARDVQMALYEGLVKANGLEKYLHTKFVGAKRFSVEGNDGVIPLLGQMAEWAAASGAKHMVMGMAHRGRLNVLCNLLHKSVSELFAAFGDKLTAEGGPSSGDVKYHLGKIYEAHTAAGNIELQLLFNPSHLEAVNPSVLGVARAKAEAGAGVASVVPVLIHGDSAVAGQGIVAEVNNFLGLPAYHVGGTIHLVLNNQVGFTADPTDAWAGAYCTDIFKHMSVPIIHVNADDIEACWSAVRFAWDYRTQFGKDVVVDLIGYRRWGHNEGDDPTFTQPKLYEKIRPHAVPAEIYAEQLKAAGVDAAVLEKVEKAYTDELAAAYAEAQKGITTKAKTEKLDNGKVETMAEAGLVKKVADVWGKAPAGFEFNDKVARVIDERVAMMNGEKPLNWGAAETAAYGTLLQEGISVRMSGQDVQRGTFSHRHAVLVSGKDGSKWNVLNALGVKGATANFYNSALSENAVMGFEYGYALARPKDSLVIWEGQFGDFANGAQVVIDQFISAAEGKWGQMNHLTLLLPHGYEGQGPEHSSARLERFLQLCAEDNMRVAYPTTPAQIFHLLRRQAKHPVKRPLIVMTPKSLLRNPAAVSPLSDLLNGTFQPVIGDTVDAKGVKRVVVCSGKIYYDLVARREADKRNDVAIVRMEEFYPWPAAELAKVLGAYKSKDVYWVQEEPRNMGAWSHVREYWNEELGYLHYIGRKASASPAVGTTVRHAAEQKAIVDEVFGK